MSMLGMVHKHLLLEAANRFLSSLAFSAMVAPTLRIFGARVGKNARIYSPLVLNNTKFANLLVGDNCHIGRGVLLDLADRIEIGDNVTISMNTTIVTHVDFGDSPLGRTEFPPTHAPVKIGVGSYIGAGATILHGVEIGESCVVAAGAVVRRDVPSNEVVAGVPARTIPKLQVTP